MGIPQSHTTQPQPTSLNNKQQDYLYIMKLNSIQFGIVHIYQLSTLPHNYIMQYTHQFLKNDQTYHSQLKYYQSIPNHKNIVGVEKISFEKTNQMCIPLVNMHIYSKYYNFTLHDAIELKKNKYSKIIKTEHSLQSQSQASYRTYISKFTQPEIWYVLQSLASVAQVYETRFLSSFGNFKPINIYISPEGYIKIYLLLRVKKFIQNALGCKTKYNEQQIKQFKQIMNTFKSNNVEIKESIYSFDKNDEIEMDLINKSKNNISQKYPQSQLSDVFDIGLIILSMITLDSVSQYYDSYGYPKTQFIFYTINNLDKRGTSYQLQTLLKQMMSHSNRITASQVITAVDNYRNFYESRRLDGGVGYCLKLNDEENDQQLMSCSKMNATQLSNLGTNCTKKMSSHYNCSVASIEESIKPNIKGLLKSRCLVPGKVQPLSLKVQRAQRKQ